MAARAAYAERDYGKEVTRLGAAMINADGLLDHLDIGAVRVFISLVRAGAARAPAALKPTLTFDIFSHAGLDEESARALRDGELSQALGDRVSWFIHWCIPGPRFPVTLRPQLAERGRLAMEAFPLGADAARMELRDYDAANPHLRRWVA